jgi:hypothetical protein
VLVFSIDTRQIFENSADGCWTAMECIFYFVIPGNFLSQKKQYPVKM